MKRRGRESDDESTDDDSSDDGADGGESETRVRIHLKRSCTDRKLVPQENTGLGLTTDDWQKFKRLLESKTFAAHDTKRVRGNALTAAWAAESGFREPVIATDKTGMGIKVPDASFTVADVARVVGDDVLIRPIHVGEQANIDQHMTLAEFAEYFETCTKPGQAILNMISLEFSDTPLAKLVQSPQLVRDIDWVNWCWPDDRKSEGQFPKVQYYCLMSQGGSYTDFHVDFGGTSVWYHILRGKKEFLLIRPTPSNLKLYEDWIRSPTQSQVFFGDLADVCYRVVLNAGETMMIPSGWIHAVFTPKPSLVFGGNFLHSLNIPMQLQIHAMEVRAKILHKFRFPYFREMMFFAASRYLRTLREQQGELLETASNPTTNGIAAVLDSKDDQRLEGDTKGNETRETATTTTSVTDGTGIAGTDGPASAHATADIGGSASSSASAAVSFSDDATESDVPTTGDEADCLPNSNAAESGTGIDAVKISGSVLGPDVPAGKDVRGGVSCRVGGGTVSLSAWEIEGLPQLLEACRAWVAEEAGDASGADAEGEEGVLEEWEAAATAAGCPNVDAMLQDLSVRVAAVVVAKIGSMKHLGDEAAATPTASTSEANVVASNEESSSSSNSPLENRISPRTEVTTGDASAVSSAVSEPTTPTHLNRSPTPASSVPKSTAQGRRVGGEATVREDPAVAPECSGSIAAARGPAPAAPSIPKLKIFLKPPTAPRTGSGGMSSPTTTATNGEGADRGLKLVLKRSAISPGKLSGSGGSGIGPWRSGGSASGWSGVHTHSSGGVDEAGSQERRPVGGTGGVSALLAVGERDVHASDQATEKAPKAALQVQRGQQYESSSSGDEDGLDRGDQDEDSSDGDGEARLGRGGKRRARPLGSRLRAIARLGDDAAGGGSEDDDSADEYKPDGEDDIRPDDHKIKLDAEDLRETKRAKAAAGMPARSGTAALKSGNAWSGFGSSGGGGGRAGAGGSGGAFSSASPSDGVVGGMRMSVTKKEALRSKGVFKIAPQSKVSVQAGKKEKKPLTAKQKLLLKMRR